MDRTIEDFVRGLGVDAYLVGGAVRDELLGLESKDADFVVPGVDNDGLRRVLQPHGRVEALARLRYPARLRTYVERLIRAHAFWLDEIDERFARRFLREHGDELAFDLVTHKQADLTGKQRLGDEQAATRLRELLERERSRPHRLQ